MSKHRSSASTRQSGQEARPAGRRGTQVDGRAPDRAGLEVLIKHGEGGQTTFCLQGELDLSTSPQVFPRLEAAIEAGGRVVVDLSDCEFIDSSGLQMLLELAGRRADGIEAICPPGQVRRLLALTGAERVLRIREAADMSGPDA